MIFKKNIFIFSVVFSLVFFSGGVCTQAWAMPDGASGMGMAISETVDHGAMHGTMAHGMDTETLSSAGERHANFCLLGCGSILPQWAVVKKSGADMHIFLSTVAQPFQNEEVLVGKESVVGESLGRVAWNDVLLSVEKRE